MSAILYGSADHTATAKYTAAGGGSGNVVAFGGTLVWRPRAGAASATRVLVSSIVQTPNRGWDIRTGGTNATVSVHFFNAASGSAPSATTVITSVQNKVCIFSFQWDGVAGRLRVYLNRVETGTGTAIVGYAPSTGGIAWGSELVGATAPGTDSDLYGLVLWDGLAALAQVQSQHDAILANDGRIQRMPGAANTLLVDPTLDALENGGVLGATLTDRIGTNHFTRAGSPSTSPQYARAFGF